MKADMIRYSLLFYLSLTISLCAQSTVVFNEVMSNNEQTLTDEDGDFVDWIELYNPADVPIQLEGYGVSDDAEEPFKWTFPALELQPQQHLLVFASDKDRRRLLNWKTVVREGDTWRYHVGHSNPGAWWNRSNFDDSGWPEGASGFGYSDNDDNTTVQTTISIFIRTTFEVEAPEQISRMLLHMDYDDAFVAYLNGKEIARANIGTPGRPPRYNQTATSNHEALMIQGLPPEQFEVSEFLHLLQPGDNVLAVQGHNVSSGSSDLSLIPFLTLGSSSPLQESEEPPEVLPLPDQNLHANFKVKSGGERLSLVDTSGLLLDTLHTPVLTRDVSYGRFPDGESAWMRMALPSPGNANQDSLFVGVQPKPLISRAGGFYEQAFAVQLSDTAGGTIYYTLDGSEPDKHARAYTGPITIHGSTVVRARSYNPPSLPSRVATETFVFNKDSEIPVVCLTSDPYNLFDEEYGIFAMGPNAENQSPHFGANFWQDWERPVHVEFYEPDGTLGFKLDAGMKVFGGWSRARPQKSVAIFQRGRYDSRQIEYQIFPDKEIDEFEAFLLRNGGNDWDGTLFRDGFMQYLCKDAMDLDIMAFRPAHVYLNGDYWGILNLREKINEHFLASNRGIDPDRVDILDGYGLQDWQVMAGSNDAYREFWQFMETHDMANPEHYAVADSFIDIHNFIDYQIAEIFIANTDWPGNNIKYYRPQREGGKWRWLIYDTDFGFHLYDDSYTHNTLAFATEPNGSGWPNPPWSTFLLRSFLENDYFRHLFISRFADHLNTTFEPQRVNAILDEFEDQLRPEINRQQGRWPGGASQFSSRLRRMRNFADRRVPYVQNHIRREFDIDGMINVTLRVDEPWGSIHINSKTVDDYPWVGKYFQNVPLSLTAIPKPGYRFVGWNPASLGDSLSVVYDSTADLDVTALFEPAESESVVLNEINYNSSRDFPAGDWVELHNPSNATISLAGWSFRDAGEEHRYYFPNDAHVPAQGYAVLTGDTTQLNAVYPRLQRVYGNIEFDLSNAGEYIAVLNPWGAVVDSLSYDDVDPWPTAADGEGYTLELRNSQENNATAEAWAASAVIGGTPRRSNSRATRMQAPHSTVPTEFVLHPNYPNPFNPSTTIRYDVPRHAQVRLTIYDTLGRLVARLVDSRQTPGIYNVTWNADVASGVYFYRLDVDAGNESFSEVRKMMLLR